MCMYVYICMHGIYMSGTKLDVKERRKGASVTARLS